MKKAAFITIVTVFTIMLNCSFKPKHIKSSVNFVEFNYFSLELTDRGKEYLKDYTASILRTQHALAEIRLSPLNAREEYDSNAMLGLLRCRIIRDHLMSSGLDSTRVEVLYSDIKYTRDKINRRERFLTSGVYVNSYPKNE